MDKRSSASLVAIVAVLLGILGAYTLGAVQRSPAVAADQTPPTSRTISIDGVGEVVGVPDQVAFDLTIREVADDLAAALDEANATMRAALSALAEAGVARKDVQTTGLSMDPVYRYPYNAPPVLEGYRVTQRAEVVVRELKTAGKVITAVVSSGQDSVRVSDLRLRMGNRAQLLGSARDEAIAEARAKAEQYAAAAGQQLGGVTSIKEVSAQAPQYVYSAELARAAYKLSSADASVPIRAGSEQVKVSVAVVWELNEP